ncbi:MAG: sce7726 family protein [Chloroflexi bacterium]|nr:sce7726 family protein [Chloroflexota bacterium]
MNDIDIRRALKEELMRRHAKDSDTLVLDELGVRHGAARIDLVVVNHRLHGYEIKSDLDSLRRLPDQIRAYSSVMDRVTLVVGYRHAFDALEMVPEWWGVRLAERTKRSGAVVLSEARSARDNPGVDLNEVAALLWRDEALAILEDMGEASGVRTKRRSEVYRRLVSSVDSDSLRSMVRRQLKYRRGWRVVAQQMSCGD